MWLMISLWVGAILAALYLFCRQRYSVFSRRGVKTPPYVPLVGNLGRVMLKKEHFADYAKKWYFEFPEERFFGTFELTKPTLVIRDIELIKKIAVKDFDHFVDHRTVISSEIDPIIGRTLISLTGQEWRDMRSTLSPAFTSSKIRMMVPFMVEVGYQMIDSLMLKIKESGKDYLDIDVKDLTTRYANDVIASCAFGLKLDSQTDVDNQFYTMGRDTSSFQFRQVLVYVGYLVFPKLMKYVLLAELDKKGNPYKMFYENRCRLYLDITLLTKKANTFFRSLVLGTMKNREENNIIRPDMIHLLMEAKKGSLSHDLDTSKDADAGFAAVEESHVGKKKIDRTWTDDDLIAQAILFFLAGFETVSSGMSFLLHELAVNPEVQEKLVEEIRENDAKNGGKFDYKSIQNMTYMDMVISELLRRWPPAFVLDRLCVKDYNCGKPNSTATEDFILRKGDGINIPAWALHMDPEYFPEPYKFDPERFSDGNKHKIHPFSYNPFGIGPRNCIGSRFALCEMKVMTYQLLQHMEVSPGEKTCIPAELCLNSPNIKLKGGHWVRFKIRN